MNTRTLFDRLPLVAVLGAGLTLAACGAPESDGPADTAGESIEGVAEGDALTGAEIEEAVPGVEDANPEGETGNTANLGDPANVEYSDDPNSDREAKTAAD
ncbi:hypothetical protein [Erythrobacter crassostreae]|uniref:Secreted protein n=1 Tax=Erythrobacter crassostreae TaxID=2828328 RepID=A0A9X1F3X3_9SPHN|nr:hypothetical protein [Erythrobacter crassostrea]MBV7258858.1 hypothetical protein [Erythrobacter crassostrea]